MTRPTWLCPVVIGIACVLLAFGRLIVCPGGWIVDAERPGVDPSIPVFRRMPGNDLTRLFVPHHLAIARSLHATGRVPTWDPRGFGGRPLVGNPQAGLWYPPNWLVWITREPALFGWITLAHLVGAMLGMVCLARSLGLGPFAATLAGVVLALNPYVLAQVREGHLPQVWAACWIPWIVFSVRVWRGGDRRGGLAFAPLVALCALTGHPQVPYLLVVGLGVWFVAEQIGARVRGERMGNLRSGLAVGLLLALPVALTAVSWLPQMLAESWTLVRARGQVAEADRYAIGVANLLQWLDPLALGGPADYRGPGTYWETQIGVGGPVLLLAMAALVRADRRRRTLVNGLVLIWLIGLWLAAGRGLGLASVLGSIMPGMGRFRVPGRVLFLAAPAVALLAALGIETLARRGRWVGMSLGGLAMAHLAVEGCLILKVAPPSAFLEAGPAARLLVDRWPDAPFRVRARDSLFPDLQAAMIGVDKTNVEDYFQIQHAADLYETLYPQFDPPRPVEWLNPLNSWVLAQVRQGVLDRMNVQRLICDTPPRGFAGRVLARVSPTFSRREKVPFRADEGETGLPCAPQTPPHPDPLSAGEGGTTTASRGDPKSPLTPALSQWEREGTGRPAGAMGTATTTTSPRQSNPGILVLDNPTALPRAYVVPRAAPAAPGEDAALHLAWIDPRAAVMMEHDPFTTDGPRQPFTPAAYRSHDPDHLEIAVETRAPGLLVVADTWMPGWSATVDGRPAAVERGNHAQRVIVIPSAGRHMITMHYVAPGLQAGAAISLAGLLTWLLVAVRPWFRPSRAVCG